MRPTAGPAASVVSGGLTGGGGGGCRCRCRDQTCPWLILGPRGDPRCSHHLRYERYSIGLRHSCFSISIRNSRSRSVTFFMRCRRGSCVRFALLMPLPKACTKHTIYISVVASDNSRNYVKTEKKLLLFLSLPRVLSNVTEFQTLNSDIIALFTERVTTRIVDWAKGPIHNNVT